ncbi:MAG: Spy/CpxP family protein refolding chaperone [Terriglobales bacterium]
MNLGRVGSLSAVLILMLATVAGAQTAPPPHRMHGMAGEGMFDGGVFPFFSQYLDLTDEQHAQIKQIFANAKPTMQPLMQQERQSRQAMMQLVASGNFDQAKAQTIAAQESQIHAQIEVQHALLASQAYQVLTPDQRTKLNDFLAKREQRFEKHMQEQPPSAAPEQAPN